MRWTTKDGENWYKDLIHNIILEKQFESEAKSSNIKDSIQYKLKNRQIKRSTYSNQYLNGLNIESNISEEDILLYFNENIKRFDLPEKRVVYHIFKKKTDNAESVDKEMNNLRKRVLQGENFMLLAKQKSESETRHNSGLIDTIKKGDFSPEFDDIIFNLEKNNPSKVIKSKDGYHIFYVSDIFEKKKFEYEEVKNMLRQELIKENKKRIIKKEALKLIPEGTLTIPNLDQLYNLIFQPQAVVLEIGDFKILSSEFIKTVNELSQLNPSEDIKTLAFDYLQDMAYREVIYQYMINNHVELKNSVNLELEQSSLLIQEFSQFKIRDYISQNPKLIVEYYNNNLLRFSSAIRLNLKRLTIPKKENTNIMPILENAIDELNEKSISLEILAQKYNGEVRNFGMKNINQLNQIDPRIFEFSNLLNIGEHSVPFTNEHYYFILQLLEKSENQIQPLPIVREQVIDSYIQENKTFIFKQITEEIINGIQIDELQLGRYISSLQK